MIGLLITSFLAIGLLGVGRYVWTFWLYRGYAAPSRPAHVTLGSGLSARKVAVLAGSVHHLEIKSPALGGRRISTFVYLPPGYSSHNQERYPVLYLLHGNPGDPNAFLTVGDVADTEDTLVAEDKMRPLVLVMPDGSVSYLVDEEWANGIRRRSAWETFVARDLVNTIDNRYRVITTGSGRAIGGLSEGGYGALNIGLQHIGEFRVLESWSGYMEADPIPAIFGKSASALRRNSPALEVAKDVARVRAAHTYIWFYCGTDDFTVPQNRQFNAELSRLEVPHWFAIRPGQHTWRLWRSMMPASLETASAHLSHA